MARRRVYFLAGTYQEAHYWAAQLGFRHGEWSYLAPHGIHGIHNPTVYLVGTYYARPDWPEIQVALEPTKPTLIYGEEMVPRGG